MLYASSYKKEPWTNWFGTDGIVYPDLTIGDVMVDPYEQHMELEQRLAVAYPQMKEAFNNGTAYAWFNGKKNELTLRNMTLNCGAIGEEVRPISTAHDINVNLEGDNHFTGRVTTGMYFGGLTTLNITGTTQIDMEGDCYSLDGIVCFRLELAEEMDILSPNRAHFGLSDNGVHYGVVNEDDALVVGEIVIGERNSYYVFVGGVELTKELCQNPDALVEILAEKDNQLMEDYFEGTVEIYYIPETKTLHMKNFHINLPDANGIANGGFIRGANRHGVLGLNIEVEGDCSITTEGTVPVYDFNGPITLTGGGTLTLRSDNNIGICCYDDFTLDGPTVASEGTIGFYCSEPYKETRANILGGTMKVKGSDKCILAEQLNLSEGIFITKPDGAQWSDSYYSVVDADRNIVKNEWVVIGTAIATGISDEGILMKNESLNAQTVYDLQGRRISMQHPSSITSGIYIVNSRKVIVR